MVFKVNGSLFDVPDYYELTSQKPLGKGAYGKSKGEKKSKPTFDAANFPCYTGVVVAAKDKRTGTPVAIKKIIDTFADLQVLKFTYLIDNSF